MKKHPGILTIPRPDNPTEPAIVDKLRSVFDSLDDHPLIQALTGPIRRGPKGHSILILWHCVLLRYIMGLGSTEAMRRMLRDNPYIARVCGVTEIPHHSTFSRFISRLSKRDMLGKVKDVSRSIVRRCYEELPGFGQRVALDSSTLKGWVNGTRTVKSDLEAKWSVKKGSQGQTEYVLGWKLHLLVDCEYELPISANVSPGNSHDSKRASNVLSEARFSVKGFRPQFLLADKGYSGRPFRQLLDRAYDIKPIIQTNPGHKRLMAKESLVENTSEWKALYNLRPAVERVFSRLKGQRSLNNITVRGKRKVNLHCYLSLIALQMLAIRYGF